MYNPSRSYDTMSPYSYQPKIQIPTQNQTSIALFHIPSDAKNSIYVDGVPNDATEREVSRKIYYNSDIFRPYPGFQQIRLIRKSTSTGR